MKFQILLVISLNTKCLICFNITYKSQPLFLNNVTYGQASYIRIQAEHKNNSIHEV
jgi:hypothetical protein